MPQTKNKVDNKEARTMPFNIEAEQAILCSVLIDKTAADEFLPRLCSDDFYSDKNRIIFERLKKFLTNLFLWIPFRLPTDFLLKESWTQWEA